MYSIKPNLSKQFILNHITEANIFEHYLGIPVTSKSFKNPLRIDHKNTCDFFIGKDGVLIMHDYSGFFSGDCFKAVMVKFNCSFRDALKIIANDFGLIKSNIPKNMPLIKYSKNPTVRQTDAIIQAEIKQFTKEELEWWFKFGISYETLKKYHVFSIATVFLNGSPYCISINNSPIYGYYFGRKEGVEQWKMYSPRKTTNRFLGNAKGLQGEHMLPKSGNILVVTKSLKDCMCFYELGIPAVAPHSEGIILSDEDYKRLKKRFKTIIVNYDGDRAGIHGMIKFRNKFDCICIPCSVKPKKEAKDISDCIAKYGKEKVLNVINSIKKKYNDFV